MPTWCHYIVAILLVFLTDNGHPWNPAKVSGRATDGVSMPGCNRIGWVAPRAQVCVARRPRATYSLRYQPGGPAHRITPGSRHSGFRRGRAGSARRNSPESATRLDGPRFARRCVARRSRATYACRTGLPRVSHRADHGPPLRQPVMHLCWNVQRLSMRCAKIARNMFIAAPTGLPDVWGCSGCYRRADPDQPLQRMVHPGDMRS